MTNAKDLTIGSKVKLTDGPSTASYAVVIGHTEDQWGHHCLVQIVESAHCEGRSGTVDEIHGRETLKGIGWQRTMFIWVNDELSEVTAMVSPLQYLLLGGSWVKYIKADRTWVTGVADQVVGVLNSVRL